MSLSWEHVRARYDGGAVLQPIKGTRRLEVIGADEAAVHVRSSFWTKSVTREHLEQAVDLIESGEISRRWEDFVERYGELVTGERRSLTAIVLVDLGYLE